MKPIEYFLTKKGMKIVDDPKYLEEERVILRILKKERKNKNQILQELQKLGYTFNWYQVEKKLEVLEKDKLVEEFK